MKQKFRSIALGVTLGVVLLSQFAVPQSVYALTFTVTKTTDTNDGACDADCSLREAIVAANATAGADIVTLTSGSTYILSIAGAGENASATGDLDVTDATGVTINTSGAGTATIDANDIDRILDVRPGGALTLNNIVITDGSATTNGGGLYVDGSTTITGGGFTANTSTAGSDGGAIYVNSGTVSINGTSFTGNSSTDDGGAMFLNGGTTTITGATFTGNTGSDIAGAIRIDADNTAISNTTFSNNTSNSVATFPGVGGGGLFINETANNTTVTLSAFNGNTTARANNARGGGIYNEGTNVVVANSTFTGNTATDTVAGVAGDVAQGGAIFQDDTGPDPSLTLYNVTLSGNSTTVTGLGTASGGTIYKNNATGTITLANTIVANGTAGGAANNCSGSAITDGGNNIDFNGGGCGLANTADPNFGALTGSPAYFPLNVGSPAIDAGSNAVCANAFVNNQSQNGLTRPQPVAGTCDIGSFERIGDTTAPTLTSFARQTPATSPTNADVLVFRATFDEDVTNVSAGDFSVNGGTTATVTGVAPVSGSVYDITVSGGDLAGFNGTVGLDVAVGQNITDLSSNALPTSEPTLVDETYVVDNTLPVVTIGAPSVTSTTSGPVDFAITITGATTINLTAGDITLNTTGTATGTVSVTNGTTANPTVTISGVTGDGTIGISIAAGVASDAASNTSAAAGPSATFIVDNTAPTVTMSSAAPDPTNTSPIPVTVQFSEAVSGFTILDITPGNGTVGNFIPVDADTYTFDLTPSAQGLVTADIAGGVAFDAVNNGNTAALQFSRTFDTSGPLVTIGAPSVASTTTGPVDFPITITGSTSQNLLPANVTLNTTGTATGTVSVTNGATANPTVTISGITGSGTIGITIAAGVATDGLNTSAGAGPSATFIVDNGGPVVTASVPANGSSVPGPTQLTVTYNEDVQNLGLGGAANTANYLLVEAGVNTAFDTVTCLLGVAPDDVTIAIDSAAYANGGGAGPFVATLNINGGVALPVGTYRLYVCGTTSVQDLLGNELNNGAADTIIGFTVVAAPAGGGGGTTRASAIPVTGFPQGELTSLPLQPADRAYTATTLWLEIPSLGVKMEIVGVPQTKDGWDTTWLNRDAGWLNGSAFPTWSGNSVITGHVWDAFNKPGPFTKLKDLKYGDQVKIHAFGQVFLYEIRDNSLISPSNVAAMLKHEEKSWLTLVTCDTYNEKTKTYKYRRMVRAVLISVSPEK